MGAKRSGALPGFTYLLALVLLGLPGCDGSLSTGDGPLDGRAADRLPARDGGVVEGAAVERSPATDRSPGEKTAPPPACGDGLKNQTEADVDCGGPCPACANGKACLSAADCSSGYCHSSLRCEENPLTADGCYKWPSKLAPSVTLGGAVQANTCVEVQAGTYTLDQGLTLSPGRTLRGVDAATTTLRASTAWSFHCCDAMVSAAGGNNASPIQVRKLTLDGAGVATYNVCCEGYTVEASILKRSRCSAIGIVGTGVVARANFMLESAQPTSVPGKGTVTCATGGFGGVAEGAAIYSEGKGSSYGSLIESNVITGSYGPALDVNGAWGGTFRKNTISGNTAWAAVSLYGASNWTVEGNTISHPAGEPAQPYHPYCRGGPGGPHSAGIFLCQDTDANGLTTNGNQIAANQTSSYYGILSIGADELKPYWAPRNNTFTGNDVMGSSIGCADDFKPGQWLGDANVWSGNNCAGVPNTGPMLF